MGEIVTSSRGRHLITSGIAIEVICQAVLHDDGHFGKDAPLGIADRLLCPDQEVFSTLIQQMRKVTHHTAPERFGPQLIGVISFISQFSKGMGDHAKRVKMAPTARKFSQKSAFTD
jgi:hypothetical protein